MITAAPRRLHTVVLAMAVTLVPAPAVAQAPAGSTQPEGTAAGLADPGAIEARPAPGDPPFVQPLTQGPAFTPRVVNVPAFAATGFGFVPRTIAVPPLSARGLGFVPRLVQVPVLQARSDTGGLPSVDIAQALEPVTHPQPAEPGAVVPGTGDRPQAAEPDLSVPAWSGEPVVTDTLRMTGLGPESRRPEAAEPDVSVPTWTGEPLLTDTLRMTGLRSETEEQALGEDQARFTLVRVVPLTPGAAGTNPFDFQDLREDIVTAQTPAGDRQPATVVQPPADGAPVTPAPVTTPLTLVTPLPFQGSFAESILTFHIDAAGPDTLSVTDIGPGIGTTAALQTIFNGADLSGNTALFDVMPGFALSSRSHPDPVSQAVNPAFVVRRDADGVFFRIVVGFSTLPATSNLRIDTLSGVRCGPSPGDCP